MHTLKTITLALMLIIFSVAGLRAEPVAIYATSAKNIRIVPLVQGDIPNLNEGVDLVASAPCEDDITQSVFIVPLNSSREFLTIWWNKNTDKTCYSRFISDGNGSFTEKYMGDWLGGGTSVWSKGTNGDIGNIWSPLPSADLNGDKIDDLVLIRWHRLGTRPKSVEYKVALGQSDGSFDFSGIATTFITGAWTGSVTLADTDGDNHADLVYYRFRHGGSHSTDVYSLKGRSNGTFASVADKKLLVSTGAGRGSANLAAIGDFNSDGYPDLFLPPDDDVLDEGQAYISFGDENSKFTPILESIDFVSRNEGRTGDTFSASTEAYDVNLDGHLDIVANANRWNILTSKKVYFGNGNGQFSITGKKLFSAPKGTPYPRLAWLFTSEQRAEEISLEQFANEFNTLFQAKDWKKIGQLFINNPNTAKQFQQMLARAGEGTGKQVEQTRALAGLVAKLRQGLSGSKNPMLARLLKEGKKAYSIAEYRTAIRKWEQGLNLARQTKSQLYIGAFIGSLGVVYDNLEQYQKALIYQQQALEINRKIDNKYGVGNSLNNIGNIYGTLDQYQKALNYYQQALEINRKIGYKREIGINLANIGVVYKILEQYQKALIYQQQALEIIRKIDDKYGMGKSLSNIGNVYGKLKQYQKDLNYQQQALKIRQKIGDKHGEAYSLANIGVVYKHFGKYQKAKKFFQNSLAMFEKLGIEDSWKALHNLASIEAKLNQPELAIQHYQQALDNIEILRTGITTKELKTSFMRKKRYIYDELIALLQSQHSKQPNKGYDRKAIEIFERKQGRLFLEEMGQSGVRRFVGLDDEIITEEQSLMLKWQKLEIQAFTPQEYTALEQAEEQLKKRIKAEYPKYYALKYPQPVDLATLQSQVLQENEMMLVYGVMKKNIVLWVIGKQHFQMFTLPVDETTLKQEVKKLRAYFNPLFKNKFLKYSQNLYQTLLPEAVRQLIKDAKTLYIIPTGPLYGLPFGSLVTSNPKQPIHYLIEDYPISYLSSASLLKILRTTERKTQPSEPFLAFADPEYPPCNSTSNTKTETFTELRTEAYLKSIKGNCFTRLAATADEVREIANLFNADHSKALYLGAKASRSTVFALNKDDKLDDYRYIMFSVHGIIPNKTNQIEQPALVLSNPTTDGYLTMADAFALKLNADFVNLSACNTGCTKKDCSENVRGEGIMGLTRAFMYAGTSRVAVTLWSVDLYSSKDLNVGLFTHLKANKKMAHALREIKLKMIQGKASNEQYAHPYHWAGFVVYGDGQ